MIMADFIQCKLKNGDILEVDIDEDRTVSLETLKSLYGPDVSALTLIPRVVEKEL